MIVYKVTNLINGKIYIGQTKQSLQRRKRHHINDANRNPHVVFHKALIKYGEENFRWEILISEDDKDKINELEKSFINEYNCIIPNGYNMTQGGDKALWDWNHLPSTVKKHHSLAISKSKKGKNQSKEFCEQKRNQFINYWKDPKNHENYSKKYRGGNNPNSKYKYFIYDENNNLIKETTDLKSFCDENKWCHNHVKRHSVKIGKYKNFKIERFLKEY